MMKIKQEKVDDYESVIIMDQGNENQIFIEDYKLSIEEPCIESEPDPLSTTKEFLNSQKEIRNSCNINLERLHTVHKKIIPVEQKKPKNSLRNLRIKNSPFGSNVSEDIDEDYCEIIPPPPRPKCPVITLDDTMEGESMDTNVPVQEAANQSKSGIEVDQNSERIDNEDNTNNEDGCLIQEPNIDKYLKMWSVLYPRVQVQEQRNLYEENNGNVRLIMDKIKLLNEERTTKILQTKLDLNKSHNGYKPEKAKSNLRNIRIMKTPVISQDQMSTYLNSLASQKGHQRLSSSKELNTQRTVLEQFNNLEDKCRTGITTETEKCVLKPLKKLKCSVKPKNQASKQHFKTTKQKEDFFQHGNLKPQNVPDANMEIIVPDGWRREVLMRTGGGSAGKYDIYYFSPKGKKLRSGKEVERYCLKEGIEFSSDLFNWSRGGRIPKAPKISKILKTPKNAGAPNESQKEQKEATKVKTQAELMESFALKRLMVDLERIEWDSKSMEQKKIFLIEEEKEYRNRNPSKRKSEETVGSVELNKKSDTSKGLKNLRLIYVGSYQEDSNICQQLSEKRCIESEVKVFVKSGLADVSIEYTQEKYKNHIKYDQHRQVVGISGGDNDKQNNENSQVSPDPLLIMVHKSITNGQTDDAPEPPPTDLLRLSEEQG